MVTTAEELIAALSTGPRLAPAPDGYQRWLKPVVEQVENIWSEATRTVPCPFCEAPAGEGCHVRGSTATALTHDARAHVYVGYRHAIVAIEASVARLKAGVR